MATYTSNYGWTKPSGSDNVDISVLNDNLDDQDSTIHDAFLNMAPPFSESSTYAVDDIVLYGTGLYKCHTAVVTPGSWTGSTNWQVYKLSEGGSGGGGTSNYNDLTNKPSINGVTLSGNKTTSALGIDKTAVGLGNVPNVSTNNQTPTFTEASTRNNIASGEKLSVILGKVQKFFNDLKTVAFSGSYTDLSDKPTIPTTASGITYDNTDSGLAATDVQGAVDELRQADNIMMSDGVTSVEDALDDYYNNKSGTVLATATADGVKTYAQLLLELYPYSANGCYIDIDNNRLYGNNAFNYGCVAAGGSNKIRLFAVYLSSRAAYYLRDEISNSGAVTFTDLSSTVPATGNTIKLIRI